MNINLKKAEIEDAGVILEMQRKAFLPLLQKYQDYDLNPGNESLDQIIRRFKQEITTYYFIDLEKIHIGAVRLLHWLKEKRARISPIFVLPKYQGKGYAQQAIQQLETLHKKVKIWQIDTILQEEKLCHLYEKFGYKRTGKTAVINDRMTIVYYQKGDK